MRPTFQRTTALFAASVIAGSAGAQQATTVRPEAGAPPSWDVLMRGRTHVPTPTTAAITAAGLKTRLYIFADDSMRGRLLGTAGHVKGVKRMPNEVKLMGLNPRRDK